MVHAFTRQGYHTAPCHHEHGVGCSVHTYHPDPLAPHPLTSHTHHTCPPTQPPPHTHPHTQAPGTGRNGVRNYNVINVKGGGGWSGTFLAKEGGEGGCTREGERGGGGTAVVMKYVIVLLLGS